MKKTILIVLVVIVIATSTNPATSEEEGRMTFLEKYRKIEEASTKKSKARQAKSAKVGDRQKQEILAVLERAGIEPAEVDTNGYWFHFPFQGMEISFVNQTTRICCDYWRTGRNDDEKKFLEDVHIVARTCESAGMLGDFKREFLYGEIVIDGDPASGVENLLSEVRQRIEEEKE